MVATRTRLSSFNTTTQEAGLQDAQGGEKHGPDEQRSQKGTQKVGGIEDTGGLAEAHPKVHLAGQGKLHAHEETVDPRLSAHPRL